MTFARILQILLAGLFVGLLPLRAGDNPAPGGDGGVVILPTAIQLSDTSVHTLLSQKKGAVKRLSVCLSLAGDSDVIRFKLPEEMVNAYAVIVIPELSMVMPVVVIAGYIEIEIEMLRALGEEINRLDLLVVSSDGMVLRITIKIGEDEQATVEVY